ncbi:MAG: type II toxin-antitoxin system RelE/ParE family toxin [Bacteroidota bacterium]|nr:type II toxin-antitoxin system RelE/ParE family toxin [Bacteroidota bacterium]
MEVVIKKSYIRNLKRVPKPIFLASDAVIDKLRAASSLERSGLDYIKMEGQRKGENYYRIRIGEWRIGIEYVNPTVIIICILSRGNIYKHFP